MPITVASYRLPLVWLIAVGYLVIIIDWGLPLTPASAKGLIQVSTPVDPCSNKTILFVGASRPLPPRDQPLAAYLSTLGYTVVVRSAQEVKMPDVKDKDLIIISESVESEDIKKNFRHVTVPLLTWEGWLYDDLQMTGPIVEQDYGELTAETSIRLTNPTHPLAAGLNGDVQTARVNNQISNKFHWGVPSQNAIIVATTLANSNRAHIFAYEQGVEMVGLIAPARRIGLHNATGTNLTPEGWLLFEAAVKWALNCPANATPMPTSPEPTASIPDTPTSTQMPIPTATATPTPTYTPPPTAPSVPGTTPTPSPTTTLVAGHAQLSISNTDYLFTDADRDDHVSAGDTLLYALSIQNTGDGIPQQIRIEDEPDANTVLITGSVRTNKGSVIEGNNPGDQRVVIAIDRLENGASATLSLQVAIKQPLNATELQNQARITFNQSGSPGGQSTVMSDDPDTPAPSDTTITQVDANLIQAARLFLPLVQSVGNGH